MNKQIIAPAFVFGTVLSASTVLAQSFDGSFSKRFYIGVGAGQSILEPDTGAVAGLEVADDSDVAGLVTLGFDFSRRLTAELQYADLGTATLNDGDGIEYEAASLTGLFYLWNWLGSSEFLDFDGLDRRAGLSLYGRLGVGTLDNEAVGSVQFERSDDAQLVAGLGVEYALAGGLGVRAELINFDSDANYGGVSLLYRFGSGPQENSFPAIPSVPENDAPTPPATAGISSPPPVALPPVIATVVTADSDADGVPDEVDSCPATSPGTPVNPSGCIMFNGVLDGINFLTGSDTLTEAARSTLDEVVGVLRDFPDVRISIQAHTDSQGEENENLQLSRNRALAVARYLTAQGVPVNQLEARAFGESQPVADNDTRAGRLQNRRVEFFIKAK